MAENWWRDEEDRWHRSDEDRWRAGEHNDYGRRGREDWRGYSRRDESAPRGSDYDRDYSYNRGYGGYGVYGGDRGRAGHYGSGSYGQGRGDYRGGWGAGRGYYGGGLSSHDYGRDEYGRYRGWDEDRWSGRDDERGFFDRAGDEVRSWFGDDEAEHRRRMDAVHDDMRHHRGRGPRGYKRSDERIREDINDRLTDDLYLDASDIEVTVSNAEATLSGTVDSRMAKRRAEDIAERVSGIGHVQNNLRVKETETSWGASTTTGSPSTDRVTRGTTGSAGAL